MRRMWAVFCLATALCLAVGCGDAEQTKSTLENILSDLSQTESSFAELSSSETSDKQSSQAESVFALSGEDASSAAESSVETEDSFEIDESSEEPIVLPDPMGKLLSISLLAADNPALTKDVYFEIDQETLTATLTVDHQHHVPSSVLQSAALTVSTENGKASFDTANADGCVDLTKQAVCTVTDENGCIQTYVLQIDRSAYKIPIVEISLSGGKTVGQIDRNATSAMQFSLDCSMLDGYASFENLSGKIRGRGNSTWLWEKKPYKIKLDEKASLMGLDDNRDWILLANYADKSLLRNVVAYEMGRTLEHIAWAPHQIPVDLFVNGEYRGVYGLGEHMEVAKGRVAIEATAETDTDFFLEVGGMEDGDKKGEHYFHTPDMHVRFITYQTPSAKNITSEQKAFLSDYFARAEQAIESGEGYEEYIDVDSFIDWMILHELCYNLDSCFRRSCYMIKEKGGKLKMGPIWDFDLALGNFSRDNPAYDDWATVGSNDENSYIHETWCNYLLQDKEFCARFAERWNEVRDRLLSTANQTIDRYGQLLQISQQANFEVWQIWGKRAGYQAQWCSNEDSYEKQLAYLKNFLRNRAEWMDGAVAELVR